jgi:hypothetical protein
MGVHEAGGFTMKKADFRTFYRGAHAVECLTEREKMLMGLAVAMMQLSLLTPNINMAIMAI